MDLVILNLTITLINSSLGKLMGVSGASFGEEDHQFATSISVCDFIQVFL